MTCPVCNSETTVYRTCDNEDSIKRERVCNSCDYRFHTIEIDSDLYERMVKQNETQRNTRSRYEVRMR